MVFQTLRIEESLNCLISLYFYNYTYLDEAVLEA